MPAPNDSDADGCLSTHTKTPRLDARGIINKGHESEAFHTTVARAEVEEMLWIWSAHPLMHLGVFGVFGMAKGCVEKRFFLDSDSSRGSYFQ